MLMIKKSDLPVYAVKIPTDTNMVDTDQISNVADVFWKQKEQEIKSDVYILRIDPLFKFSDLMWMC